MAATSDGSPNQDIPSSLLKHFEHLKSLPPHRIRWFYKEEERWKPFSGADSLNIEKAFRSFKDLQSTQTDEDAVDLTSVTCTTVRGSLYEADILGRECRPLYWRENSVPIKRGTWFIADIPGKWEAFDEHESVVIEDSHVEFVNSLGFGSSVATGGFSSPITSDNIIHQIKLGSNRIEWHDISEVFIVSESTGSRLVQKMGFSGPRRLNRGYEIDCNETDCLGPITQIVFLVHGIGQLYYEGGIVNSRRKLVRTLTKSTAVPKHPLKDDERVEFFPIEWRTNLKLDEGIINNITPNNLSSLRNMINATTMDVLYYASPLYREEIIQTIREKLNLVYREFCERNPAFKVNGGKVSIIAHSLGSVIMHDMLTMWNSHLLEKDKKNADQNMASHSSSWWVGWKGMKKTQSKSKTSTEKDMETLTEELHNARFLVNELEAKLKSVNSSKYNIYRDDSYSLLFKVENVFNIGSPLGVFLVMRGVRPRDDLEQHLLPTSVCKRTHNIYDPSDPIAYRLEPLIYSHYSTIPPVRLASLESDEPVTTTSSTGWFRSFFSPKVVKPPVVDDPYTDIDSPAEMEIETEQSPIASSGINRVLRHRIDYVLEPSLVEYFSAITAHQSYWQSADFAKFVMQVLAAKEEAIPSCL